MPLRGALSFLDHLEPDDHEDGASREKTLGRFRRGELTYKAEG